MDKHKIYIGYSVKTGIAFFCAPYYNMGDNMFENKIFIKTMAAIFIIASLIHSLTAIDSVVGVFSEETPVQLPILMYHNVLKDTSRTGKYTITPGKFEEDLIYLKSNGYETVSAKQLVQYVHGGIPLPKKPVMLTFDDGMYNNMQYILPILEKHDSCAVFSVVGSYTDEYTKSNEVNPAYSYMRWQDISELSKSGRIEFGNHSYNFHTISGSRYGTKKKKTEDSLEYINIFYQDTQKMQSEFLSNCNFRPIIYTYPFGSYSKESSRVLKKMGFLITLSCEEGINKLTNDSECLYFMRRFNRDGRMSSGEFFRRLKL